MTLCNDPKCGLNRQGVSHEDHETIQSKEIKNPCLDGRCGLNRIGVLHESHDESTEEILDEEYETQEDEYKKIPQNIVDDDDFVESPGEALGELGKRLHRDYSEQFSRKPPPKASPKFTTESPYSAQQTRKTSQTAQSTPRFSSEEERILYAKEPHEIFGFPKNVTFGDVKTRYKELVKKFDASRGIINKTSEQREKSNKIMTNINHAFSQLKRIHKDDRT